MKMLLHFLISFAGAGIAFNAMATGVSDGAGGSRFYYDTLKIQALVSNPSLEKAFRAVGGNTLDGIELKSIDDSRRVINYDVRSGNCHASATLTWDDGMNPNYRMTSVSAPTCY